MAFWKGVPVGTPRRPGRRLERQPSVAVGYLLGTLGGAVVLTALAAAALQWDWAGRLQRWWQRFDPTDTVSGFAVEGDEEVSSLGGALRNRRSVTDRRLQDASHAAGVAADHRATGVHP